MEGLLAVLEHESRRRGLLSEGELLTPEVAFAVVRDMPYQRASSRRSEDIIREWRGTCSGKHYLLAEVLQELGLETQVIMCTHRFTPNNTQHFPLELRQLVATNSVPDVHTYLKVKTTEGWTVVDATWPRSAETLGMMVNHSFTPGRDMKLACEPIDTFEVPAGRNAQEFKEQLIQQFCGPQSELRDAFIEGMGSWLKEFT